MEYIDRVLGFEPLLSLIKCMSVVSLFIQILSEKDIPFWAPFWVFGLVQEIGRTV